MNFKVGFDLIVPHCAQGIVLYLETFFFSKLHINMTKKTSLVSDSQSLKRHWLLSCVEAYFFLFDADHCSVGPGVCRDPRSIIYFFSAK